MPASSTSIWNKFAPYDKLVMVNLLFSENFSSCETLLHELKWKFNMILWFYAEQSAGLCIASSTQDVYEVCKQ